MAKSPFLDLLDALVLEFTAHMEDGTMKGKLGYNLDTTSSRISGTLSDGRRATMHLKVEQEDGSEDRDNSL